MAAQEIGSLFVALGLDSAAFSAGVRQVQAVTGRLQKGMDAFADRAQAAGARLSVYSAAVAAVGAAGLGLVKQTADAAGEIRKQASIANAGTEEFQRMAAGAKTVGIEQDKLADILKDVNDRVGDFNATGGGPMADFFENIAPKVGITADAFKDLSGPEALQLYVSSLEKAGVDQQQMTFYMEAVASDATALIPLLKNNGAEMTRLGDASASTGQIMSGGLLASSAEFSTKLRTLQENVQGVKNRLAEALMPTINSFIDYLIVTAVPAMQKILDRIGDLITWFGDLSPAVQDALSVIANALGTGGPVLLAVGVFAKTFSALLNTGPLGLFIGAATLAVTAWQIFGDDIKAVMSDVTLAFVEGWEAIKTEVASWPGKFIQYGKDMVAGLVQGIRESWSSVTNALSFGSEEAMKSFTENMEIQSPSRVFRGYGKNITEGLALGITDQVPLVGTAMDGVATALNGKGQSLATGLYKFRDAARTVFSQVAFQGAKLGDSLRGALSGLLGGKANSLFNAAFDGLWGALKLPAFANGTNNFAGGLAQVNERGGEIMNLPRGTQIIPNDISKRMADRAGGALSVIIGFDASAGAFTAYVQDQAGRVASRVVAQAAPGIVQQSVGATYRAAREVPIG